MAPYYYNSIITQPFIIIVCLFLISTSSFSKIHPCLPEQHDALLQFKETHAWLRRSGTSRTELWQNDTDCCMWIGVTCDYITGDVISLDISGSSLTGTIDNNSSLFHLRNLQSLDLSGNLLSGSLSSFSQLPKLLHLDLSGNLFSSAVPHNFSHLSQLMSLNFSSNNFPFTNSLLESLIQNLPQIQELNLNYNRMDGVSPSSLTNLSSTLTSLTLSSCSFRGRFPEYIFHLPNLRILDVSENLGVTGILPNLNWSSPLISLDLSSTNFSGNIPDSIGNLKNLENLNLHSCHFTNSIPPSSCSLSSLRALVLSGNKFSGSIPQCLGNLTNLQQLDVSLNQLTGPLPQSLSNCTLLKNVNVSYNMLTDTFPFWMGHLPKLNVVDLGQNRFYGPVGSLFNGSTVVTIILHHNDFSCHLPHLDGHLSLSSLDLSSNSLEGPIPELPQVIGFLKLSNNNFTGEIPLSICNFVPVVLDLSNNSLTGTIPPCLLNGHYISYTVINLAMNKLEGPIPDIFPEYSSMLALDLSGNQLKGPLPRSMVNCTYLRLLDLSNNNIEDFFPSWLETLRHLRVLALASNKFNGKMNTPLTDHPFPSLRMLDISNNNLTGLIQIEIISQLDAMKKVDIVEKDLYMEVKNLLGPYFRYFFRYFFSTTLTVKGSRITFSKILESWTLIDLSNNNFQGEIPQIIGDLVALKGLNLSHNNLTGGIPLPIQNLTRLEWLDLSSNKLSGLIPSELTNLTELSVLNLSYNQLKGMIPKGRQFDTFGIESFLGNRGLCGTQVAKACGEPDIPNRPQLPLPPNEEDGFNIFDWKIILMGYGCGLVIGVSTGYIIFELQRPKWLVSLVEEKLLKKIVRSSRWRS